MAVRSIETKRKQETAIPCKSCKGAVINYAREVAGRQIQNFAKNFLSDFNFFFIAHPRNYIWFHGPFVLHMRFLGTRKSMNCQADRVSKNTVVTLKNVCLKC